MGRTGPNCPLAGHEARLRQGAHDALPARRRPVERIDFVLKGIHQRLSDQADVEKPLRRALSRSVARQKHQLFPRFVGV
jgi:hypothetical protein